MMTVSCPIASNHICYFKIIRTCDGAIIMAPPGPGGTLPPPGGGTCGSLLLCGDPVGVAVAEWGIMGGGGPEERPRACLKRTGEETFISEGGREQRNQKENDCASVVRTCVLPPLSVLEKEKKEGRIEAGGTVCMIASLKEFTLCGVRVLRGPSFRTCAM